MAVWTDLATSKGVVALLLLLVMGGPACAPRVPFGDDRGPSTDAGLSVPSRDGSWLATPLGELARGETRNLGRYECAELAGSGYPCQTIYDWSRFVYDGARQKLLWFGGGEHGAPRTDVTVFDFTSLAWQSAYSPTPCGEMTPGNADLVLGAWKSTGHPMSRQTYDMLVMAEVTSELVMLTYNSPGTDCSNWPATAPDLDQVPGRVAHYDPDTRRWRFSSAPANRWPFDAAAEYDPISRLVVVLSSQGLWTYDPVSELVEQRFLLEGMERLGYSAELVYFPPTQTFFQLTRTGLVFEVSPDRGDWSATRITEITDAGGPRPPPDAKGWAYDSVHRTLGGGLRESVFSTFDPATRTWTQTHLDGDPGSLAFFTLAFDEADGVFVFFTDYESGFATWAYRP